jgi:hypothetical protein
MESSSQVDSLTINFLNVIIQRNSDTSIVGYTKTIGYDYYAYVERYARKKIWDVHQRKYLLSLSKKERRSIEEQVLQKRSLEWPANLLPQSELIKPGTSNVYIKNYPTRDIYQFTDPIFIRGKSLALILIKRHYRGNTRGYEEIAFYKKSKSEWIKLVVAERSDWGK